MFPVSQERSDSMCYILSAARGLQPSLLDVQLSRARRWAVGAPQGLLHQVLHGPARGLRADRRRLRGLRVPWNPALHGADCGAPVTRRILHCVSQSTTPAGAPHGAADEGLRRGQRLRALRGAAGGRRAEAGGPGGGRRDPRRDDRPRVLLLGQRLQAPVLLLGGVLPASLPSLCSAHNKQFPFHLYCCMFLPAL
jgi:hypothetical protein